MKSGARTMGGAGSEAAVLLSVFGSVLLWASAFPVMKALLEVFHPLAMIWARMVIASVILLPFVVRGWRRAERRPGDVWWLLALAGFEPCLYFLLEINALRMTSASQAGMVVAVFPLLAAVGGYIFYGEALSREMKAGLLLSICGVIGLTLAGAPDHSAPHPWLGNFLEFLAMCAAAGYMLIVKRMSRRYDIWLLTGIQMLAGAVFFLPGAFDLAGADLAALARPANLGLLLYLGIGVTVLAYGLYNAGVSRLSAARASVMLNMIPVIAFIISWAWLGETLNPLQLAFAALTLAGVFLAQKKPRAFPA